MTTKSKLENMLINKGLVVDLLWGVQGQWRKTIMDVMRWEAHCHKPGEDNIIQIGSWYTMTECVRRGFDLKPDPQCPYSFMEAVAREKPVKSLEAASG